MKLDFAVVIPMANEENDFSPLIISLTEVLDMLGSGKVYFVVDEVSYDATLALCNKQSLQDSRFVTVWAPENKNVVDAYIRGYKEALKNNHQFIIEMDAGLSHDPRELPMFLSYLKQGKECVFGSRFIKGGSFYDSTFTRIFLSKAGTVLSNLLLGTKMYDMTSGFQGFNAVIVDKFVSYTLLSKAHFYQTELRYLLRMASYAEIPINYRSPSPRMSMKAILNSLYVLMYYFIFRLKFREKYIV